MLLGISAKKYKLWQDLAVLGWNKSIQNLDVIQLYFNYLWKETRGLLDDWLFTINDILIKRKKFFLDSNLLRFMAWAVHYELRGVRTRFIGQEVEMIKTQGNRGWRKKCLIDCTKLPIFPIMIG